LVTETITDNDATKHEGRSQSVASAGAGPVTAYCHAKADTINSATLAIRGTGDTAGDKTCTFSSISADHYQQLRCNTSVDYGAGLTDLQLQVLVGADAGDTGILNVGDCNLARSGPILGHVRASGTAASLAAEHASASITVPAAGIMSFSADIFAIEYDLTGVTYNSILYAQNNGSGNYFQAYVTSGGKLSCLWTNGAGAFAGDSAASLTAASTVQCKYDGVNITACVNGACTTTARTFTPESGAFTVHFASNGGAGRELDGQIGNVCLAATTNGCTP
jgi:hypothetical protein